VASVNSCKSLIVAGLVACLTAAAVPATAHQTPPQVVTFVKVDGARARVLVRVPTIMLTDARLPMVEMVYLDLRAIDARLRIVATEVARSLDLTDNGRPLPAPAASWIVSLLTDRSFDSWERAVAHLTEPPIPADRFVYWNEAFADFQFDYALPAGEHQVSARVNGLRMGGDFFQTRVTYVPAAGRERTMTVVGPPQRLEFEPGLSDAVRQMVRRGAAQLGAEQLLLLFVFCLAIPQRRLKVALKAFTAFLVAHVAVVLLLTALPGSPDPAVQWLAQAAAGALLVVAAIQNIASAGPRATMVVSVLFGAANAVGLGLTARAALPVAGSHGLLALTAFLVAIELGAVWLLVIAQPLLRLAFRLGFPSWLPLAFLSAIPAHEGSHAIVDAATRLAGLEVLGLSQPVAAIVVNHWPVLTLAAALVALLLTALTVRRGGTSWLPPDAHTAR
jgi:hypothetical protein